MGRCILGAALFLALTAAAIGQDEKKSQQESHGTVKKVDAEAGTLTVAQKGKGKAEKEFTLTETTKVVVYDGTDRRQWTGKKGLKDDAIKQGRRVTVVCDGEGNVVQVRVGMPPADAKGQEIKGLLKKVDADAGTLTVAVQGPGEAADKQFTVTDSTKVVIVDGKSRKELTGKDALKEEAVKEGVEVTVFVVGRKVSRVRIGPPPKKDQ